MSSYTSGLAAKDNITSESDRHMLSEQQHEALAHLAKIPDFAAFKNVLEQNMSEFFSWLDSANPESNFSDSFKLGVVESAPKYV